MNAYHINRYYSDPEYAARKKASSTRWREKPGNKEKQRLVSRTSFVGITVGYFYQLLERSKGKCYICGTEKGIALHIDHDHKTGEVRGLLCNTCNSGLGKLRDSIPMLEKAVAYLRTKTPQSN